MSTHPRIAAAALAALTLCATHAGAASFTIDGGVPHVTPGVSPPGDWRGNDVIPGTPGYIGAQLTFHGQPGKHYLLALEFTGYEALWVNSVETGSGAIGNRASIGTTLFIPWRASGGADVVPFTFWSGAARPLAVTNGRNPLPDTDLPNFFLSVAGPGAPGRGPVRTSGPVVHLALDDSGAGPDVDHDDWVGTLTVASIPEPSVLVLVGGALAALGVRLRRRPRALPHEHTLEGDRR